MKRKVSLVMLVVLFVITMGASAFAAEHMLSGYANKKTITLSDGSVSAIKAYKVNDSLFKKALGNTKEKDMICIDIGYYVDFTDAVEISYKSLAAAEAENIPVALKANVFHTDASKYSGGKYYFYFPDDLAKTIEEMYPGEDLADCYIRYTNTVSFFDKKEAIEILKRNNINVSSNVEEIKGHRLTLIKGTEEIVLSSVGTKSVWVTNFKEPIESYIVDDHGFVTYLKDYVSAGENGIYRHTQNLPAVCMQAWGEPYEAPYTDINGYWAENIINEAYNQNLTINLAEGTEFKPAERLTTREFYSAMVNIESLRLFSVDEMDKFMGLSDKASGFKDFTSEVYAKSNIGVKDMSAAAAYYLNVLDDTNRAAFAEEGKKAVMKEPVTRGEVITAVYNGYGRLLPRMSASQMETTLNDFTDGDSVPGSQKTAAAIAVREGWISGYPDGSLGLDNPVTRSEFICMILNAEKDSAVK